MRAYRFKAKAKNKILSFYSNVAKKYKHTYDIKDLERNISDAVMNAHLIEKSLPPRKPTLSRWLEQGYHMANTDKWYYAYIIDGDTITIQDACHEQNMHNDK